MRSVILDSLRGIAVILVLFRHYYFSDVMTRIGWIGVDLFFVLSGFLVSGLLFKEYQKTESIKPVQFLIRRGFKIYPLFYFFLILTCLCYFAVKFIGRESAIDLDRMIYEVFFLQNYFKGVWIHTWSLAIEEHFYFLLAALVFLLIKFKKLANHRLMIIGIISILCLTLGLRFITLYTSSEASLRTLLFATHLRIDSLLFGVLISYVLHFLSKDFFSLAKQYWSQGVIVALLFLIIPFVWDLNSQFMLTIGLTLLYLAFGIILWIATVHETVIIQVRSSRLIINGLAYVGGYSYSIYLFHLIVASFAMPVFVKTFPFVLQGKLLFIVYVMLCILSGVVFSKLIELPFLAMRDKYFSKRVKV